MRTFERFTGAEMLWALTFGMACGLAAGLPIGCHIGGMGREAAPIPPSSRLGGEAYLPRRPELPDTEVEHR